MGDVQDDAMAGKTVVVTGGTSGIGYATALGLAGKGAQVAVTGRDQARTESAAGRIRAASRNDAVRAFAADLSVQSEVRRLSTDLLDAYPRLDVLVNNVGGFWAHRHVTTDGLEHTFALNHLAGFLLTNLLLDRLKANTPSRVVTVSSHAQSMGTIDFEDLQGERGYTGSRAYNQSKLANVVFTYELARRLRGSGVTATALHPGVVRTSFSAEDPSRFYNVLMPVAGRFMKSPSVGARTSIYLASSPEVEGVSGSYFAKGKFTSANKSASDAALSTRLWRVSAELVGLTTPA